MTIVLVAELEACGYNVIEAPGDQKALRMIEQTRPDILLLDINMLVRDSFAKMRKIRENPSLATLSVLAVTAYTMRGDRESALNPGFDGYLSKSINPSDFTHEIERWLHMPLGSTCPLPSPCMLHTHILGARS
jgi:two-component system, cell cycle response regulator DivK